MNGFTYQYAIAMPNGELYAQQSDTTERIRIFYLGRMRDEETAESGPFIYSSRDDADKALQLLRASAACMGVADWCGVVVQRLCTPFTIDDPAQHFAAEIERWITAQTEEGNL